LVIKIFLVVRERASERGHSPLSIILPLSKQNINDVLKCPVWRGGQGVRLRR
jgi:hypothetical protein